MSFIKIAEIGELESGEKKLVTIEKNAILLVNIDGNLYAVDNKCTHMGGSLFSGTLEGKNIICPKHKSVFDITTGKAVGKGKMLFVPVNVSDLKTYTLKTEGSDIFVDIH